MKKVPELRFKEFTDEWEEKKLGEIGKVSMCKRILKEQTSQNGEVPFYKIGTFGKKADAFISLNLYKEYVKKYSYPKKGTILISASGTIGRTVKYDGEAAYFQDSNIVWLENDETKLLNQFLYYIYKNINWTTEDTTIARLYNDNLLNVKIMIPIIKEQQKIADFLSAVDEKIEKSEKKLELLKDYKKGMMQKIFAQEIRFKDENGNDYPAWEEKKLEEIIKNGKSGGTPKTTKKEFYENGNIKFLSISDMTSQGKYIYLTEKYITEEGLKNSSAWKVPVNSLIYSMYASVGFVSINKVELATSQAMFSIIPKDNILLEYLYYFLSNLRKSINKYIEKGTQGNLSAEIIKNFFINFPILEEQQKIADFLSSIDDKIEKEEKKVEELKEFKKGLLQKMFV